MQEALTKKITEKLEKEFVKRLRKERRLVVNKVCELYPELKKNKKKIMIYVNNKQKSSQEITPPVPTKKEVVVEQILHEDETYYIRDNGSVYQLIEDGYSIIVGVMGDNKIISHISV